VHIINIKGGVMMKRNWMAVLAVICIFLATVLITIAWLVHKEEKMALSFMTTPLVTSAKGVYT